MIQRQISCMETMPRERPTSLEALYLSGTTKSHRGTKDRDLIQFGREESHLETIVEKKGMEFQIDMHLKKKQSKRNRNQ